MSTNSRKLLEQYVKGKDEDLYQILEDIYSDDAVVNFEIASEKITFPENVNGNKAIAEVLSRNFNLNYKDVKTYYLAKPTDNFENIYAQNWLVIMRDIGSEETRVGTGYYNWQFSTGADGFKIGRHKIYIHEMLSFIDDKKAELNRIQSQLTYPWVERQKVCEVLSTNDIFLGILQYLR